MIENSENDKNGEVPNVECDIAVTWNLGRVAKCDNRQNYNWMCKNKIIA